MTSTWSSLVADWSFSKEISKLGEDVASATRFYSNPNRAYFLALALVSIYGSLFSSDALRYAVIPMLNFMLLVAAATGLFLISSLLPLMRKAGKKADNIVLFLAIILSISIFLFYKLYSLLDNATKADLFSPLGVIISLVSLVQLALMEGFPASLLDFLQQRGGEQKGQVEPLLKLGGKLALLGAPGFFFAFFFVFMPDYLEGPRSAGLLLSLSYFFYSIACSRLGDDGAGDAAFRKSKGK